ncbi:MAG: hypothetical protein BMS9Abin37_1351 [Acidobacteriota bacterium]|nr:MAG: hypothetical protein BMS9Abin37_1351 [Acidobacteriota bacterium]
MNENRSRALAEELMALELDALSSADLGQLEKLLLDHLGVAYCGARLPWGEALRIWAARYDGSGRAAVFGSRWRTGAAVASLVNATAAHGLELDDTHDASVSHPGAAVIATAIAVGLECEATGKAILPAIAAGYEAIARVGVATGSEVLEKGFHPTALFAGFGAATTAAHLLGLEPEGLAKTWGLLLSMVGGSMQFSQEAEGTTVKRLHGGLAAMHGVLAAEMASLGIDGPLQALDGTYGLCHLYGERPEPKRLTERGEVLEIHRVSFKPYPCCRLFHSTFDALEEATDGFRLPPAEIASIRIGGPKILASQHMLRRPTAVMAAQYSLPYALGAALYYGPRSVEGYSETAMREERILAIAEKVECVEDEEMESAFPEHFGSWIEVATTSGDLRRASVLDSRGTPARPPSFEELASKFEELTGLSSDGVVATIRRVGELENLEPLVEPFLEKT